MTESPWHETTGKLRFEMMSKESHSASPRERLHLRNRTLRRTTLEREIAKGSQTTSPPGCEASSQHNAQIIPTAFEVGPPGGGPPAVAPYRPARGPPAP